MKGNGVHKALKSNQYFSRVLFCKELIETKEDTYKYIIILIIF